MATTLTASINPAQAFPGTTATVVVGGTAPTTFDECLVSFLRPSLSIALRHDWIPQDGQIPAASYHSVDGTSGTNLNGMSGLVTRSIQVTVFATDARDSFKYSNQVRNALAGYRGKMGVMDVFFVSVGQETSMATAPVDNSAAVVQSYTTEYHVTYAEPSLFSS